VQVFFSHCATDTAVLGNMLDAYYEEESKKVTEASADIESQLYHEKPVSDAHDPVRRNAGGRRGRRRGRAVFAQTEFRPDMAEWHATPHLAPCLRVKGTALDIEAARVCCQEAYKCVRQSAVTNCAALTPGCRGRGQATSTTGHGCCHGGTCTSSDSAM